MGRPSKRTPEREARVLQALSAGNTRRAAAAYAGIDQDTFANWLHRYSDFSDAIQKAEADAEVLAVAHIRHAMQDGTWQAAAWWLERRRADDYGRRDRVDLELFIRTRALALGLDQDEALREVRASLRALPTA